MAEKISKKKTKNLHIALLNDGTFYRTYRLIQTFVKKFAFVIRYHVYILYTTWVSIWAANRKIKMLKSVIILAYEQEKIIRPNRVLKFWRYVVETNIWTENECYTIFKTDCSQIRARLPQTLLNSIFSFVESRSATVERI